MGRRPVLLLSRDEAYSIRNQATVATITTRVRGIRTEIPLGRGEGLPKPCAVNVDNLITIPLSQLDERITALPDAKLRAVADAIRFALSLDS
jgi:mRNA interferase MazF